MPKNFVVTNTSVLEREELFNFLSSKPTKRVEYKQLKIWEPIQNTPESKHPLSIERLPDALQWWSETRYWIIHKGSGLRIPGSFTFAESRKIQKRTQHWDWRVDTRDRKVACGLNLLALAEGICSKVNQQGGMA